MLPTFVSLSSFLDEKLNEAYYGFTVLIAGANKRLQATEIDANPGAGITDSVVTPLSLGWHKKRADATAYYTLYLPTGRYEDGATNNTGLGMWGQELGFGTTVYLTEDRKVHAATMTTRMSRSRRPRAAVQRECICAPTTRNRTSVPRNACNRSMKSGFMW